MSKQTSKIKQLYEKRNGLFNLADCRILDDPEMQKEFISIMIDSDFLGIEFGIMSKHDCLEVKCRPDGYGKKFQKTKTR